MDNVLVVLDGFDAQTQAAQPRFLWGPGCGAVRGALRSEGVRLVATRASLPDGNWHTLLRELVNTGSTARLVVCSPKPDAALQRQAEACGADFAVCELSDQGEAARRERGASAQAA
jgi:DNA-binding NarL/FixJ family response regulator